MPAKTPTPVCKAFLLCRQILHDKHTTEASLIGIKSRVAFDSFPATASMSAYLLLKSGHGEYAVELRSEDMEGEVVWAYRVPVLFPMADPLMTYDIHLNNIHFEFPKPGKYDIGLLLNGEEVHRETLTALGVPPPEEGTDE